MLLAAVLGAMTAYAQQFRQFGGGRQRFRPPPAPSSDSFDGAWHFCRLAYSGRAWATDYPDADYNFSTRLSELTKTVSQQDPGR